MSKAISGVDHVDGMLPIPQLFAYGLQHVLAMYAGAVAVPIIIAQAMNLPIEDLIRLITADLFTCGVATLIQTRLFPPVVTGTIITIIGINLMPVAVKWMGGGAGSPNFGDPLNIALGVATFVIVIITYRFGKGFIGNLAILVGLILGTALAMLCGVTDFSEVGRSQWVSIVTPFYFGLPTFDFASIISMIIVMLVVMVETTGDSIAVGEIVDKPIGQKELAAVLRADGLSTLIGGILNSFPYTAFAQNVGLIAVTRVKSRFVVAASGVILILLGLFPKLAAIVACIPNAVLGGAGIAMFGMIIASGIRSLGKVSFDGNYNLMLVAISIGVSMIPLAAPNFYAHFQRLP